MVKILSSCVPTAKTKITYISYFHKLFHVGIRDTVEKKSEKFKGILFGDIPTRASPVLFTSVQLSMQPSSIFSIKSSSEFMKCCG